MCNVKQPSSKQDIEGYFRAVVAGQYAPKVVGPFRDGGFCHLEASAWSLCRVSGA